MYCQSSACFNRSKMTCATCNIVTYCSEACLQKDIPGHSIICNADYPQMLRAYCNHLKNLTFQKACMTYTSHTGINGELYDVGFSSEAFCICCKTYGYNDNYHVNSGCSGILLNDNVYYKRCDNCHRDDLRICPLSYVNTKLCWSGLASMMILREYIRSISAPSDIFRYILGIVSEISCKQHLIM